MLNAVRPVLVLAAVAAFVAATPAFAEETRERRAEASERIREVERDGGRVLRAERVQRGGEETYRLKVLTPEGRVRVMHASGRAEAREPESRESARFERRGLQLRERMRRTDRRADDGGRREQEQDDRRRDDD